VHLARHVENDLAAFNDPTDVTTGAEFKCTLSHHLDWFEQVWIDPGDLAREGSPLGEYDGGWSHAVHEDIMPLHLLSEAYRKAVADMYSTPEWEAVRARNGWVNIFNPGDDFASFLEKQEREIKNMMIKLGFL